MEEYEVFQALDPILLEDFSTAKGRIAINVDLKALKDLMNSYEIHRIVEMADED